MHTFRRKYPCKRPFIDQPEAQDSIHEEDIVPYFEQDHEDLEGFKQIESADPDCGPPSSNR